MWFMFVPKGLTAPCPRGRVYGSPVCSLSAKSELSQESADTIRVKVRSLWTPVAENLHRLA